MRLLTELRQKAGLNKTEMAAKLGIGKSYYTLLEQGRRSISKTVALRIHAAFGVPLEQLLTCPEVYATSTDDQAATLESA